MRIVKSALDNKSCLWREGEELRQGYVEKVTDKDMVYVQRDNGQRYYLPLHRLVIQKVK